MDLHACETCGLQHIHPGELPPPPESDAVRIAKIEADRDVAVERLRARQTAAELETAETIAETAAEAEVAVAETEADAAAEVAEALMETADEPGEVIVAPEPEPEPEDEMTPPEVEHHERMPARKPLWSFG